MWGLCVYMLFTVEVVQFQNFSESVYSYRGGSQRKIILTVEQNRDQHYRMVLWGAGAAWCPQLKRKKGKVLVPVGSCKRIFVMLLTSLKCAAGNFFPFTL